MDAASLQDEINRYSSEVKSQRDEARRIRTSAMGDRSAGDNTAADAKEKQASDLEQRADQSETKLKGAESHLAETVVHVEQLNREEKALDENYQREKARIQGQRNQLLGGVDSISSSFL